MQSSWGSCTTTTATKYIKQANKALTRSKERVRVREREREASLHAIKKGLYTTYQCNRASGNGRSSRNFIKRVTRNQHGATEAVAASKMEVTKQWHKAHNIPTNLTCIECDERTDRPTNCPPNNYVCTYSYFGIRFWFALACKDHSTQYLTTKCHNINTWDYKYVCSRT